MLGFAEVIERFAAETAAETVAADKSAAERAAWVAQMAAWTYERSTAQMDPLLSADAELAMKTELHAIAVLSAERYARSAEQHLAVRRRAAEHATERQARRDAEAAEQQRA